MLYKILNELPPEARKDGSVDPKTPLPLIPLDLKDGFIHLSTKDQVAGSLNAFYSGPTEVVILHVDGPDSENAEIPEGKTGNKYRSTLKWDWVESRQAYFPHLYGDLTNGDIVKTEVLKRQNGHEWEY